MNTTSSVHPRIVAQHGRVLEVEGPPAAHIQAVALSCAEDATPQAVGVLVTFSEGPAVLAWGPEPYEPRHVQEALLACFGLWEALRAGAPLGNAPSLTELRTLPTVSAV